MTITRSSLWQPGPVLRSVAFIAFISALTAVLFFLGPALAAQRSATRGNSRSIQGLLEESFGTLPALGLKICCTLYLIRWLAYLIGIPAFLLLRNLPPIETAALAAGLVIFLFVTGLQNPLTSARMAFFSNRLGIVLLIAAIIRARHGLPAALRGALDWPARDIAINAWHGILYLSLSVAPLLFLASSFGARSRSPKQVAKIALFGLAIPLCLTLSSQGILAVATSASELYRPSLRPDIGMALGSGVAARAVPAMMMIATLTLFGAARFGVKMLAGTSILPTRLAYIAAIT